MALHFQMSCVGLTEEEDRCFLLLIDGDISEVELDLESSNDEEEVIQAMKEVEVPIDTEFPIKSNISFEVDN